MSIKLHHSVAETGLSDAGNGVDDSLIEKVWCDLDEQLPWEQVDQVVTEVALEFQNAKVKAFLPILIHRRSLERLKQELQELDEMV